MRKLNAIEKILSFRNEYINGIKYKSICIFCRRFLIKTRKFAKGIKINVGCGDDYREGFINIDGSGNLPKVDLVLDMDRKSLTDVFAAGSVAHILANDVVEHRYHWEAIKLLKNFHQMLMGGGFWKYAYRT